MRPCPCISDPPDHASSASRTSTVSALPAATTISSTPPASVMSRRAASTTASVAGEPRADHGQRERAPTKKVQVPDPEVRSATEFALCVCG